MTRDEQTSLMRKMRQAGVSDNLIGRVFGCTRQRVGQRLGPHHPSDIQGVDPPARDRILDLYRRGVPQYEIAAREELSYATVANLIHKEMPSRERLALSRKRTHDRLLRQLQEFASVLSGLSMSSVELLRYSRSLHNQAVSFQPLEDWAKELGLKYVRYGKRNEGRR